MTGGRARRALALFIVSLFCGAGGVVPSSDASPPPARARRILGAGVGAQLAEVFGGSESPFTLSDASLMSTEFVGRICAEQSCVGLRLTDPRRACDGALGSHWCVTLTSPLTEAHQARLLDLLEDSVFADAWTVWKVAVRRSQGKSASICERVTGWVSPKLSLLLQILGMLILGGGVALVMRRATARVSVRVLGTASLLLLPPAAVVALAPCHIPLQFWDAVVMVLVALFGAALCLALATWRVRLRVLGGFTLSAAIFVLCAEVLLRAFLTTTAHERHADRLQVYEIEASQATSCAEPGELPGLVYQSAHELITNQCAALFYPNSSQGIGARLRDGGAQLGRRDSRPRVLHVGDSMLTAGAPPETEEIRYCDLLRERFRETVHVNAGYPAGGPELYHELIANWLAREPFDHVIVYMFFGNDLMELGQRYPCCSVSGFQQPLLAVGEDGVRRLCSSASWPDCQQQWLDASHAPLLLVANVDWSRLARVLAPRFYVFADLGLGPRTWDAPAQAAKVASFGQLLSSMKDTVRRAGAEFTLVVLPNAREYRLEDVQAREELARQGAILLDLARGQGVRVFDGRAAFADGIAHNGADHYFIKDDWHFSVAGHERMLEWLSPLFAPAVP